MVVVQIGKLEVEMHPEAQGWVLNTCEVIEQQMAFDKSPVDRAIYIEHAGFTPGNHALNQFTMACPHGQNACHGSCDDGILKMSPDDKHYVLRWVHDYADVYDTYWWNMLHAIGALDWLRNLVAEDVALPNDKCRHPETCKNLCSCAAYGDVILQSLGRDLLKNFFPPDPNPEWVFYTPK